MTRLKTENERIYQTKQLSVHTTPEISPRKPKSGTKSSSSYNKELSFKKLHQIICSKQYWLEP